MAKTTEKQDTQTAAEADARIIKRYSNRKLYDTKDSQYVTLQQIGEMVRRGEHVRIIDNKTKEDKTEVTLALIISEDLKNRPSSVPLGTLRTLIQVRGERLLSQLREGPIGRLIPGTGEEGEGIEGVVGTGVEGAEAGSVPAEQGVEGAPAPDAEAASAAVEGEETGIGAAMARLQELVDSSRQTFEDLETSFEERVRVLVPGLGPFTDLRSAVDRLTQRVDQLEQRVAELDGKSPEPDAGKDKSEH